MSCEHYTGIGTPSSRHDTAALFSGKICKGILLQAQANFSKMVESSIDYSYKYPFVSNLAVSNGAPMLQLATSQQDEAYPYFFEGKLLQPRTTGLLLFQLARIVGTRFYTPPAMLNHMLALLDPVITSGGGVLRFEGFSACCGAYARVDLTPEAYKGNISGTGTTNVDFNSPMRAALASVQDDDRLSLAIGPDQVMLKRGFESVIERKVKLPMRWVKGFVEVQAYQSRMELLYTLSKAEALRFLRSLPKNAHHRSVFSVVPAGKGLRLTQVGDGSSLRLAGLERLALLRDLAPLCDELKIYSSADRESSEWQLRCGGVSFALTLTAEPSRGFSGEGQILGDLTNADANHVASVRAALDWQAIINLEDIAGKCDIPVAAVKQSLAILGSRGLVGFDLASGAFFCRRLPFDLDLVEEMHPRLKSARKLVADGGVRILSKRADAVEAEVRGTDVKHRVGISSDTETCTCPWFAKYQGARGPCKHILATKLVAGTDSDELKDFTTEACI